MVRPARLARCAAPALAGLALLAAPKAAANGRFPNAQHLVVGPGASSNLVALRVTFGMLLSADGGRTFTWMCEEGMYFPFVPRINFDAPIEMASRGAVVFGYEVGLRSTTNGCKADDVRNVRGRSFSDLTSDPTGRTLYAVEDTEGMPNAVYRGEGETLEFTRLGRGVDGVLFDTIEVAPSNVMRLYLTGRDRGAFRPVFYRSDDGGTTLVPITPDAGPSDSMWVSGVDPRDPDTLYVRANVGLGTELRRSRDGGRSFQRIAATEDPMLGFAISDDGRTLWAGSAAAGLLRSDDGGESFRQVHRLPVFCLRQHAGVLWACSDWVQQGFALGRSRDQGASFEPVVSFMDYSRFVGPPTCGTRSEGAEICVERWPILMRDFADPDLFFDAGMPPSRDAGRRDVLANDGAANTPGDAGLDAGPMDATAPVDAGARPPAGETCACAAAGSSTGACTRSGIAVALAALAAVLRGRRARTNTRRPA